MHRHIFALFLQTVYAIEKLLTGFNEGLDGGIWYSLFIKNLAHYSSH